MPKITFFIRPNKDKLKSYVLYCRISYKGTTSEFSTGEKICHEYWSQDNQLYKSKNIAQNKFISTLIETISYKLKSIALLSQELNCAKSLIDVMKPKPIKSTIRIKLVDSIKEFIQLETRHKQPGTIKKYDSYVSLIEQFQVAQKRVFQLVPENIDENFDLPTAERFKIWFKKTRKTENITTASRAIEFFRVVFLHFMRKGIVKSFDLIAYKAERDPNRAPVYLTEKEYLKIFKADLTNQSLIKARDLYLFQISTGISYCDLWDWSIKETTAGKIIFGSRGKTNQTFFVPITETCQAILDKYDGKIPRLENQPYNRYLKELAKVLGIEKRITTHTGRKSFATFMDQQGWSLESIARMLGHSSIKTTETYYLGQTSNRIELEMQLRQNKNA